MKSINKILIILILANTLLFLDFIIINPQMNIFAQIFGYLESKPFQYVTIGLGLPILMFLIEDIFKVREKYFEEKREKQLESIKKTHELWNDIANVSVKFIYADKLEESVIVDLKSEIEDFIIKAEEVSNTWYFEFSNLNGIIGDEKIFTNIFLTPFDILESSISSVIDRVCMREKYDDTHTRIMQDRVRVIYNGIKVLTHHRTINIMKSSMLLDQSDDQELVNEIKLNFEELKEINHVLIKEIIEFYHMDSSERNFSDIDNYLAEIKNNKDYNYEDFKDEFIKRYDNLPDNKKVLLRDIHQFSDDLIKQLANILKSEDLIYNFNHYKKLEMIE